MSTSAGVPRTALWEVFLSLQLRVWRGEEAMTVLLPEGVPESQVAWWRTFHGAEHVEVRTSGPPLPPVPAPRPRPGRVAVSYGGGKDSALALAVLRRRLRRRDVLPVHVVQHFVNDRRRRRAVLRRSLVLVVLPALGRGLPVQVVSNDFLSTLTTAGRAHAPHVLLYGPALLPLLMARGVETVTTSRTAAGYRATPDGRGVLRFSNPTGRRETLESLSRYTATQHGYPLSLQGSHQAISELVSYRTLARLDPAAAGRVVMCMRTTRLRRRCEACAKCLEQTLFALACGVPGAGASHERVLTSERTARLVAAARAPGDRRTRHGVAPFDPLIGTRTHFAAFCHALHLVGERIDDGALPDTPGVRNLAVLRAAWGRPMPGAAALDPGAVAASGQISREVAAVAARWSPLLDDEALRGTPRMLVGDEPASFHHDAVMPTPALDLWHAEHGSPARTAASRPVADETEAAS